MYVILLTRVPWQPITSHGWLTMCENVLTWFHLPLQADSLYENHCYRVYQHLTSSCKCKWGSMQVQAFTLAYYYGRIAFSRVSLGYPSLLSRTRCVPPLPKSLNSANTKKAKISISLIKTLRMALTYVPKSKYP